MEFSGSYTAIPALLTVFCKLRAGHLPSLQKIIIISNHPDGCLDATLKLPEIAMEYWRKAISICAEAEVDLVNSKLTLIHLWNDQHQLMFMTDQEGNDGPEATEEEDGSLDAEEWYEQSSPDDFPLVYGDEDKDKDEDNRESKDQEDIRDEGEEDDKDKE
ncbi:hypothetical protein FRC18_007523, partial [Serendipita sp. 400]